MVELHRCTSLTRAQTEHTQMCANFSQVIEHSPSKFDQLKLYIQQNVHIKATYSQVLRPAAKSGSCKQEVDK